MDGGLETTHTLEACAAACAKNSDATAFQWNGVKATKNEGDWCGCVKIKGGKSFKDAIASEHTNKGDDHACTICPLPFKGQRDCVARRRARRLLSPPHPMFPTLLGACLSLA